MKIIWLGHSGFRIEIEDAVLLIDPWLTGNPMFPEDRRDEALAGATHILLSHGGMATMQGMRWRWRRSWRSRSWAVPI